jgi:hypothetical protein
MNLGWLFINLTFFATIILAAPAQIRINTGGQYSLKPEGLTEWIAKLRGNIKMDQNNGNILVRGKPYYSTRVVDGRLQLG